MPFPVPWLFPEAICRIPDSGDRVFLTFDDGPTPGVTEPLLDLLAARGAKATFFCLGKNAEAHPAILRRILSEGHAIGNHTYSHANAWKVSRKEWLENVQKGRIVLEQLTGQAVTLFRPPYGKLTLAGYRSVKQTAQIVLWDVVTGDFSPHLVPDQVLRNATQKARKGSVLVWHDSLKCASKMQYSLPLALDYFDQRGWKYDRFV
jgi:peptidoglycan/xylan/chitin deacetylase (PgdA/CDA1 family)